MQNAIVEGINCKKIYAIVRDGELKFFHADHLGKTFTQREAEGALTAEQYLSLSNADYSAREN
jgi:hypothetical protein